MSEDVDLNVDKHTGGLLRGSYWRHRRAPMNTKSVMLVPPVYSLPRILHSGVCRARSPLRRQPLTHPSAFGHRCYNTLRPSGMGINRIHFPSIALLISPDALYIYLGWGIPSGPPACLSTSRQTLLLFCSLILIWRFHPHSCQTLSELPSPSSA